MISGILETLYSAEAGRSMGQSVGNFYKSLWVQAYPRRSPDGKDYMLSLRT